MRCLLILACLCAPCVAQELPPAKPEVQAQLKKTFDTMNRLRVVTFDSPEVLQDAKEAKELSGSDEEAVKQLAVFVATTESSEDTHAIIALSMWRYLHVSPRATIVALAPYLDSSNRALRGFARDWFQGHNDFKDYRSYALRHKEIPAPLIDFMFEQSPGEAMLVLQSGSVDIESQLDILNTRREANQQRRELTTKEQDEVDSVQEKSERMSQSRRELQLAEHIVDNAIWLHKNKFKEQFHEALPEAQEQLAQLAKRKEWWARLYVASIMRRHPVFLQDHIFRQLAEDKNPRVSKAASRGQ